MGRRARSSLRCAPQSDALLCDLLACAGRRFRAMCPSTTPPCTTRTARAFPPLARPVPARPVLNAVPPAPQCWACCPPAARLACESRCAFRFHCLQLPGNRGASTEFAARPPLQGAGASPPASPGAALRTALQSEGGGVLHDAGQHQHHGRALRISRPWCSLLFVLRHSGCGVQVLLRRSLPRWHGRRAHEPDGAPPRRPPWPSRPRAAVTGRLL